MNDDNIHTSACIVMPAYHYGANELSHCTVAFLGSIEEIDSPRERIQKIVDRLGQHPMWYEGHINLWSYGYDWFGPEKDQPVALLNDDRLFVQRRNAERLMYDKGVEWSKVWDYRPHVSLFATSVVALDHITKYPHSMRIRLYPPVLWWGDERPSLHSSTTE
jgi:hypothetical protein